MPRCPACFIPMTRVDQPQFNHFTCGHCFGNWCPKPNLLHWILVDPDPSENPTGEPAIQDLAALVAASDTKKRLPCAGCRQTMRVSRLHLMIPVDIQECVKCQYVWTDVGKRALIKALFHAMKNSTDPRIVALREKYAKVEATDAMADASARNPQPTINAPGGVRGFTAPFTLGSLIEFFS